MSGLTLENVREHAHRLVAEYAQRGYAPAEINSGICDDFAQDLRAALALEPSHRFDIDTLTLIDHEKGVWDMAKLAEWGIDRPDQMDPQIFDLLGRHYANHVWCVFDGLHFDAEAPDGVPSAFDLPFFRRWIEHIQANIQSETAISP